MVLKRKDVGLYDYTYDYLICWPVPRNSNFGDPREMIFTRPSTTAPFAINQWTPASLVAPSSYHESQILDRNIANLLSPKEKQLLDILACPHCSILAMSSSNPAIGALILVPIVIAASAAFIALKAAGFFKAAHSWWRDFWARSGIKDINLKPRRKLRRSNLSSRSVYGDSWLELDSVDSRQDIHISTFINQSPKRKRFSSSSGDKSKDILTPEEVWHPSRNTRLLWSFTNPRSKNPNPFGSSNAVRPLPPAQIRETSSV